jgi:ATP-dependent DNA helicase RecQ
MARVYPKTESEFSRISGVGEKKLHEFGALFMGEIAAFLQSNPRQMFADDSFSSTPTTSRSRLNDTARETLHFFRQGKTVDDVARIRGLKESTIYGHLEDALLAGETIDLNQLMDAKAQREIAAAFERFGFANLTGAVESLGGRYHSGLLRFYRTAQNRARRG